MQHPGVMIKRTGQSNPHTEHTSNPCGHLADTPRFPCGRHTNVRSFRFRSRRGQSCRRASGASPARAKPRARGRAGTAPGAGHLCCNTSRRCPDQGGNRVRGHLHDGVDPSREVQPSPPLGDNNPTQVDQHGNKRVPLQMQPHGTPRPGDKAHHRGGLPPGRSPPPRLGHQAVTAQPRNNLADGLRRKPRTRGELPPTCPRGPSGTQQIEHQGRVVPTQHRQIHPGPRPLLPVHTPIVAPACTLATPLPK
ncbi:hypothetical protein GCM10010252_16170 [Streptomyces aureoverticillatus]|nr:hypothetical protein GCM10010252_16170 [Streptomyces aureoverticillatus]